MTDHPTTSDAPAEAVYRLIRERRNPFGKSWHELTDVEKYESRRLANAALEADRTTNCDPPKTRTRPYGVLDTVSVEDLKDALLYKLIAAVLPLLPDDRDRRGISDMVVALANRV